MQRYDIAFWKNYQEMAWTTCLPSCQNMYYLGRTLLSEVGELLGVLAKKVRGDYDDDPEKYKLLVKGEIGDCLWFLYSIRTFLKLPPIELGLFDCEAYTDMELDVLATAMGYIRNNAKDIYFYHIFTGLANIADQHGFHLHEVADYNLEKLAKRYANNTIMGSGDFR